MKTPFLLLLGAILLPASLTSALAAADGRPGGLPSGVDPGTLEVVRVDGEAPDTPLRLPLQHTEVHIRVAGFVARATVTQHDTNPFEHPIEAVYTFPLPHDAAVDAMTMHVGEAVIRGVIQRRDEARATYERAVQAGQRAGLLEQERPNIFTQSVGNIMPRHAIRIEISYVDILEYRDEGAFELVFPMAVGPRYIPGTSVTGKSGTGWSPDTDTVPDASRITPPVLGPGERGGHDISLQVELDAALAIHGVHAVSHAVDIETPSPSRREIRLHSADRIPNKDFVLRYAVAGQAPEMALIPHHSPETGGYFTLIVLPQQAVTDAQAVPRDLIFVLDTSGSMRGEPMAKSRAAMARLIAGMRAADRFNIVCFAGDTGTLWPAPRPATAANRREAERFVKALRGAGGTEMRKGIVEALAQPAEAGRMRIAILLTDGYVGDEARILAAIEAITRLGLEHRIMTQWTAFVAVQETVVNVDGQPRTVVQPVELPEGVDYAGVFGPAAEADAAPAGVAGVMLAQPSQSAELAGAARMAVAEMPPLPAAPHPRVKAEPALSEPEGNARLDRDATLLCRYDALSVSGGLRYPAVARRLTQVMPSLCEALEGALGALPDAVVPVTLEVGPDGAVRSIVLDAENGLSARMADPLRKALQALAFGPVAGAEGATLRFRLLLGQESRHR